MHTRLNCKRDCAHCVKLHLNCTQMPWKSRVTRVLHITSLYKQIAKGSNDKWANVPRKWWLGPSLVPVTTKNVHSFAQVRDSSRSLQTWKSAPFCQCFLDFAMGSMLGFSRIRNKKNEWSGGWHFTRATDCQGGVNFSDFLLLDSQEVLASEQYAKSWDHVRAYSQINKPHDPRLFTLHLWKLTPGCFGRCSVWNDMLTRIKLARMGPCWTKPFLVITSPHSSVVKIPGPGFISREILPPRRLEQWKCKIPTYQFVKESH